MAHTRVECRSEPWRAKHSTRVCAILHGMVVTDSISSTMHENPFGTLLKYKIYMKTKISDHLQPAGAHLSLHKYDCYVTVTSSLHVWSAEWKSFSTPRNSFCTAIVEENFLHDSGSRKASGWYEWICSVPLRFYERNVVIGQFSSNSSVDDFPTNQNSSRIRSTCLIRTLMPYLESLSELLFSNLHTILVDF